jgi:hypothetical protein
VFLVEKCSRFECLDDDGPGGVCALVSAVVIQALISISTYVDRGSEDWNRLPAFITS